MASEVNHHVGYSRENECWFVRFYPYQTEQQANEAAAAFTRPAPAATDTGLVTVGEVSTVRESVAAFAGHMLSRKLKPGDLLCLRSQAEELLAAERAEHDNTIATLSSLIEDNAAQAARIKELDRCHEGTIDLCNQKTAQIEALEAKLAAAEKALKAEPVVQARFETVADGITGIRSVDVKRVEREDDDSLTVVIDYWPTPSPEVTTLKAENERLRKALEPFAKIPVSTVLEGRLGHVPDKHPYMVDLDGNVLFTASDIRKARAVLGGKPS